jgi:HD superfamily phosphohydrolase
MPVIQPKLSQLWRDFSHDFVSGQITPTGSNFVATEQQPIFFRDPTDFHQIVAKLVIARQAVAVSVNFDGLTRKAIRKEFERERVKCDCVVLTSPSHLDGYYLGESPAYAQKVVSVIKVWGNVFHAVCQNPRCPEATNQVAIYNLDTGKRHKVRKEEIAESLVCPECHTPRQLQVFFPGYQEKERQTIQLMQALWRFVAPRIGVVVVAGLSGIWDNVLIEFVASLGRDLRDEGVPQPVFCIDPDENAFLPTELERRGIPVSRIEATAEYVAAELSATVPAPQHSVISYATGSVPATTDNLWEGLIDPDKLYAETPHGYTLVHSPDYLIHFRKLRQLGLKTKLVRLGSTEREHNRFRHSCGASNLAYYWITTLLDKQADILTETGGSLPPRVVLQTLALLGGIHHDLGHLPFTHFAEDVFHELNWTSRAWARRFKHDERVFETAWKPLVEETKATLDEAAQKMNMSPDLFLNWVQRSIEGKSGIPFLDAILNSPLDADKIDYVFRDCLVLGRAVHLPDKLEKRVDWFKSFVSDEQEILPSGLIALSGGAGDRAHVFLEERRWLYKYLYFRASYRVVERIARSVLTLWLTHMVPELLSVRMRSQDCDTDPKLLNDVRALKGIRAGEVLWEYLKHLKPTGGEPEMILKFATQLIDHSGHLPRAPRAKLWIESCHRLLTNILGHPQEFDEDKFPGTLRKCASWSQPMYVDLKNLDSASEIICSLEVSEPFGAIFDVAVMPRMLAYPNRLRFNSDRSEVMEEMFAVPHFDPDRWGRKTGRWIPLSLSAYADKEDNRWAQLLVLSPQEPDDPNVKYVEDPFRHLCQQQGISILDEDPDSTGVTKLSKE